MKKLFVVICLLFAVISGYANKIDSLTNATDVKAFVSPMLFNYYYSGVDSKWQVKNWLKTDLNNDNKTDLVVTETGGYQTFNFVVMAKSDTAYQLSQINYSTEGESIDVIRIDNKPYVVFHGLKETHDIRQSIPRTDTLSYQFGSFVELNKNPAHYTIESITCSSSWASPNGRPDNVLIIKKNKKAAYTVNRPHAGYILTKEKRSRNPQGDAGIYRSKIKTDELKDIYGLINYIDIKKLNGKYASHYTDQNHYGITIKFADNSLKTIADYGGRGTFGLQAIFSKLNHIIKTTNWR
ncbi:hypothetical protein [Mucilaginibacter panaciglaebae]|uniref:DUF6438 domain-containing protein n=1 Tax=Mucilaginibacter panaciglaebae TaxID=502331 RepID=A0ABP7WH39_9SPHI